jgi:hypothetical protein
MWYLILNPVVALWVFFDARSRKMERPALWGIGTVLMMILVIPSYFATRSLKDGEVREGGTAWNVVKSFAIFWTLTMFVAGVWAMIAVSGSTSPGASEAEQTGAAIGTALGLGLIMGLWFFVLAGALVIGLFLKKSSIVETGPTGTLIFQSPLPEAKSGPIQRSGPGPAIPCSSCGKYSAPGGMFCSFCGQAMARAAL